MNVSKQQTHLIGNWKVVGEMSATFAEDWPEMESHDGLESTFGALKATVILVTPDAAWVHWEDHYHWG